MHLFGYVGLGQLSFAVMAFGSWPFLLLCCIVIRIGSLPGMVNCYILLQYGGQSGELSAGLQYLTQRYTMPTGKTKGLLTDIGTEEFVP